MSGPRDKSGRGDGFDAFALSEAGRELAGNVDLRSLSRLTDRLAEGDAVPLAWRIAGTRDQAGRPALDLRIDGQVPLMCQRCLEVFWLTLGQDTLVLLARDERELAQLDDNDEHEVVLAAAPLQPCELVEEEVLLALPFVARCGAATCVALPGQLDRVSESGRSAFAGLAVLKQAPDAAVRKKSRK